MGCHVWNGERLIARSEANVDVEDRGYTFGDGIYEVFRVYAGQLFEAPLHWERFIRSAAEIRLVLPLSVEQLQHAIEELIQADQLTSGMVYLQATRGAAPRGHAFPDQDVNPVFSAWTKGLERPLSALREGTAVITQPDIRWLRCDIKSLNLLPNVLAKQAAVEAGASEAILHRDGTVTEGSSSNIGIVKDGVLWTHPANHLILHGVTRAVTLRLAQQLGIPVCEEPFRVEALYQADEAFLMGTTVEVMPIVSVDGRRVADGKSGTVTRRLLQQFEQLL